MKSVSLIQRTTSAKMQKKNQQFLFITDKNCGRMNLNSLSENLQQLFLHVPMEEQNLSNTVKKEIKGHL